MSHPVSWPIVLYITWLCTSNSTLTVSALTKKWPPIVLVDCLHTGIFV